MSCQSLAASPNNAASVKDSVSVISMTMPSMRVVPAAKLKLNPLPIKRQQTPYYRTITGHICNRSADWGLACLLHFSFFFFVSSSTMGLSAEEDDSTVAPLIYMEDCGTLVLTQNYWMQITKLDETTTRWHCYQNLQGLFTTADPY